MSIEPGLYAHLVADAGVSALVATDDDGNKAVYPAGRIPEAAPLPAITYQRASTVPKQTLRGLAGLTMVRVQITAWAKGVSAARDAKEIIDAVVVSLDGFRGSWGSVPISGITIDAVQPMERDPESTLDGFDMDVLIWHRALVP